jgi:citrate lyase beta subunit
MRHHQYKPDFRFVQEPADFTKDTEKEILQYCIGALMYMPANKDFLESIISSRYPGLTAIAMCFEDACREEDVPEAEANVVRILDALLAGKRDGSINEEDLPLIFFRVRNTAQFESFSSKLRQEHFSAFSGFILPKFSTKTGNTYFDQLKYLNDKHELRVYGMPILESREIALVENRQRELDGVKSIIDHYSKYILNVRVGATDFSSVFGMRRGIDYTIYDILTVRECLASILNTFGRYNEYVLSGPVWEYFQIHHDNKFNEINTERIQHSLLTRNPIVNSAVDGLLREVILDRANGFIGKTVIHPSHLRYVNAMHAVTQEEYEDALQVLNVSDGVVKSASGNKMNEIKPHTNWATRVAARAKVYGVVEDESCYMRLFTDD